MTISKEITKMLYLMILIISTLSIKIPIIDEDFLDVEVGTDREHLKLMIDPSLPFTYIIKQFKSKSEKNFEQKHIFTNDLGTFEGRWKKDIFFITKDKKMEFELKYVFIEKHNLNLNIDGVIGLGYTSGKMYEESNILRIFEKMGNSFKFKKVFSYDKEKKLLILGEIPRSDNFNKVDFPIFIGENNLMSTFVNLTQINFYSYKSPEKSTININSPAVLGLIPVIIAPYDNYTFLQKEYFPKITNSSLELKKYDKKFFYDVYFKDNKPNLKSDMVFGKVAYAYDSVEKVNGDVRSGIKISYEIQRLGYWYIGIDLLNVVRADFDYELGIVSLYSPFARNLDFNKYIFLSIYIFIGTAFCLIVGLMARKCFKKKKQTEILKGEELEEL